MNRLEMIPNPVMLGFNPNDAEDAIKVIFADRTARTLWLSWRVGHIVSQYFVFDCFESAKRIRACATPITEDDLKSCLVGYSFGRNDVARWAPEAVRYFNDEELRYEERVAKP